jgi:hypothetical protein
MFPAYGSNFFLPCDSPLWAYFHSLGDCLAALSILLIQTGTPVNAFGRVRAIQEEHKNFAVQGVICYTEFILSVSREQNPKPFPRPHQR